MQLYTSQQVTKQPPELFNKQNHGSTIKIVFVNCNKSEIKTNSGWKNLNLNGLEMLPQIAFNTLKLNIIIKRKKQ